MNAGILIPDNQQGSTAPDGGGFLRLGPGGEIQIEGSSEAEPYVIPDGDGPFATISVFSVTTLPATELSPSMATSAPSMATSVQISSSQGTIFLSTSTSASTLVETSTTTALSSSESRQQPSRTSSSASASASPTTSSSANKSILRTSVSLITSTIVSSSRVSSTISSSLTSSVTSSSYTSIQSIVITSSSFFPSSSSFSASSAIFTASSTNSSTLLSGTSSKPAPSETFFAPPIKTNASALTVHDPPFYVGIVLGTIAGIALLAALVAWLIRYKAKRRRAARTVVPWARSYDPDNGGLEAGHGDVDRLALGAMHLGSREDLAHVQAWSPRGDRDVGEPRRSESYLNGSMYSLHNHSIPGHTLFSDESLGALSAFEGNNTPGLRPNRTHRQLPSHLIDESFTARARREDEALRYAQYYGRPMPERTVNGRGFGGSPQGLGKGNILGSHWNQESPTRSVVERLRNRGKLSEPPLEDIGPLPTPGAPHREGKDEVEPWASTFKMNLVNAFNSVAANLSRAPHTQLEDDKLTALPRRATRKSVRNAFYDEKTDDGKGLFRCGSTSTIQSKPWTLEENPDGPGVVHLHIPGNEVPRRPSMPPPNLSFGDGESIYDDHGSDFHRMPSGESQIPLIASSKPPPAFIRPEAHFFRGLHKNVNETPASRENSMHSTFPSRRRNPVHKRPRTPAINRFSSLSTLHQRREGIDSVVIEPDTISKLPSTESNPGSEYSSTTLDAAVVQALKGRHTGRT
ncbi:hypothetical protein M413DRAFT_448127 [Hebeloma cylindrosporum]|uniref:Uncharacterized protein n=1 Tax=Hebeloma cylindrosporum TaxID=76867 RepID=A0A0C3BMB8_HEBCY|nr:hypothetical protein M413DRAFT_448127 [Hebeloma cylindrosporum h7]